MDIYETIAKRYSVRDYQDRPVEDDKLTRVLEAARNAPSGRNMQGWKLVVVRQMALRKAIADNSGQKFLATAPVVIAAVALEPDRVMHCGVPAAPVDCAIAIEHMVLAATAEGLGTCWIGHFEQEQTRRILHVPPTAQIIEMLAMGYAAGEMPPRSRKAMNEIVCYDHFA